MAKWIHARATLSKMQNQPAYAEAHTMWLEGCRAIHTMKDDYACTCKFLDRLIAMMRKCRGPETGESMPMKRKNADPAPAARIPRKNADPAPAARIPRHEESAPHQNHGPCPNDQPPDIESATASFSMASSASKISSLKQTALA